MKATITATHHDGTQWGYGPVPVIRYQGTDGSWAWIPGTGLVGGELDIPIDPMTYRQAAALARQTPFGTGMAEEMHIPLSRKVARQVRRADMTPGEKAARRLQLRRDMGAIQ